MPTPYQLAQQFRAALIRRDAEALREITAAYERVITSIQLSVSALGAQAQRARAAGQTVSAAWLFREQRLQLLLSQAEQQLAFFTAQLSTRLTNDQQAAVSVAQVHTQQMLRAAGAEVSFARLPEAAIETLIGFSGDGAPLTKLLSKIPGDASARIRETLLTSLAVGQSPRQTARQISDALQGNKARALTIARTETLRAYREASRQTAKAAGVERWEWIASQSRRTCFPAGTVVSGPGVLEATSRYYSGELVTIRTASGKELSFTPNHPILTPNGWIAGGLLQVGDDVICGTDSERTSFGFDKDNQQIPTPIEKVFESFRMVSMEMPCAAPDFHGDGEGSDVYIVRPNSLLLDDGDVFLFQPLGEQSFARRNINGVEIALPSQRHSFGIFNVLNSLAFSVAEEYGALRERDFGEMQKVAVMGTSGSDPSVLQAGKDYLSADTESSRQIPLRFASQIALSDSLVANPRIQMASHIFAAGLESKALFLGAQQSAFSQSLKQPLIVNPGTPSGCLCPLAGQVKTDRIIETNIKIFSGHVYNLSTTTGWYLANGIVAHNCLSCLAMDGRIFSIEKPQPNHPNCRCTVLYLPPGVAPRARMTGAQWFEQQPDEVKAAMMSKVAFEAYQRGEVSLQDFVGIKRSRVWGETRYERSFKDALQAAQERTLPKAQNVVTMPSVKRIPKVSDLAKLANVQNINLRYKGRAAERVTELFGRVVSDDQLAAALGALDGATVEVGMNAEGEIVASLLHPQIHSQIRTISQAPDGKIFIHNDLFRVSKTAPKGTGLRSFSRQVAGARALGVDRIETMAAGEAEMTAWNGYYTWARFGYNAPLSEFEIQQLNRVPQYRGVRDLNALMQRPGGAEVWRRNGSGREMVFLLDGRRGAVRILLKYLREKGLL